MVNYDKLLDAVRELGMDYKWAKMFIKKLADDEKAFPMTDEKKKWAMSKGFFPGRIDLYGLNDDNYRNYVPDFNYFMLHPMNNHFLKWLDKTTLKYVLNSGGCEETMPEYYVYVENDGSFTYLMDCPDNIIKDENFLMELLKEKKFLAMKPNSGTSGGFGFLKMEYRDGEIYENNKRVDTDRIIELRNSMRNYIITEYAHQHEDFDKVWPDSECTLRVIMVKNPKTDLYRQSTFSCAISFARFGASISGGASNLSAGGVGVGFDFETGKYNSTGVRYRKFCEDGNWVITEHPDSKTKFEGMVIPNWEYVKGKIHDICNHISSLDYVGLDIIITKDGLKLCEINSHPAMDYAQVLSGAALGKEKIRTFFEHKGLFAVNSEAFCKAYFDCIE